MCISWAESPQRDILMGRGLIPSFSDAQLERQAGEEKTQKIRRNVALSNKAKQRLFSKAS